MPSLAPTGLYLAGLGLAVPFANMMLDRLQPLPKPGRAALLAIPAFALLLWLLNLLGAFSPLMLVLPLLLALTLWTMRRLGALAGDLSFSAPAPSPARHLVFLLAPLAATLGASFGLQQSGEGLETNVPIALVTVSARLGLYA
jgi:hypothetical protein